MQCQQVIIHFTVLPSPVLRPTCISPTNQHLIPSPHLLLPITLFAPPLCLSERPFSSCFSFPSSFLHLPYPKGRYRTERHPRGRLCRHTLARLSSLRLHRNPHASVSLDLLRNLANSTQPAPTTEADLAVVASSVDIHRVVSHFLPNHYISLRVTRRDLIASLSDKLTHCAPQVIHTIPIAE